jgi:actin-related protein
MFQDLTSLVLDIGTLKSKIGYGGDDAPKIISNSYLLKNTSMDVEGQHKYTIGDKYFTMDRDDREIESIFKKKDKDGCEIDWEKYEHFVSHILKE